MKKKKKYQGFCDFRKIFYIFGVVLTTLIFGGLTLHVWIGSNELYSLFDQIFVTVLTVGIGSFFNVFFFALKREYDNS